MGESVCKSAFATFEGTFLGMHHSKPFKETGLYSMFGLFEPETDVVFCAKITPPEQSPESDARAVCHPQAHHFFVLRSGQAEGVLEGQPFCATAGVAVSVPPNCLHSIRFSQDVQGWHVAMTVGGMSELLQRDQGLVDLLATAVLVPGDKELFSITRKLLSGSGQVSVGRTAILRGLGAAFLGTMGRLVADGSMDKHSATLAEDALFRRFVTAIEENFAQRLEIAEYASRLSVSATHLSRVTRALTGKPATFLVSLRMMREAKRLLMFTDLGVAEVGRQLGYEDAAHFSRSFSKIAGLSPKAFRARFIHLPARMFPI